MKVTLSIDYETEISPFLLVILNFLNHHFEFGNTRIICNQFFRYVKV